MAPRSSDVVRVTLYRALLRLRACTTATPRSRRCSPRASSTRYSHEQQRWVPGPRVAAADRRGCDRIPWRPALPPAAATPQPAVSATRAAAARCATCKASFVPGRPLFHPAALDTGFAALALLSQNEASLPREAERAVADADGGDRRGSRRSRAAARLRAADERERREPVVARAQLLPAPRRRRRVAGAAAEQADALSLAHAARLLGPPLDGLPLGALAHNRVFVGGPVAAPPVVAPLALEGATAVDADGAALFVSELGGGFLAAAEALLARAATPPTQGGARARGVGRAARGRVAAEPWYQGAATRAADLEAAGSAGGAAEPEEEQQMLLDAIDEGEGASATAAAARTARSSGSALHEELDEHLICERGQDAWARMLREFGGEYRAIASLAPATFHDDDDDGDEEPDLPIII